MGRRRRGEFCFTKGEIVHCSRVNLAKLRQAIEVEYDASSKGIEVVLSHEMQQIKYINEKLNEAWPKWSIYNQMFYDILRALKTWEHFLIQKEFLLCSDHQALKYFNSQYNLSKMHARWVSYMQKFTFVLKHKSRQQNKVTDTLSRQTTLLVTLVNKVTSFECLKELYAEDDDSAHI